MNEVVDEEETDDEGDDEMDEEELERGDWPVTFADQGFIGSFVKEDEDDGDDDDDDDVNNDPLVDGDDDVDGVGILSSMALS